MIAFKHFPKYEEILSYLKENIDKLSYSELIEMVYVKFDYKFNCQESLIYNLKKHNIKKSKKITMRNKNIKGLKAVFERDMFKLEKLLKSEE